MLESLSPYKKNAVQQLVVGDSHGYGRDKMEIPAGTMCYGQEATVTVFVTAASNQSALTTTQKNTALNAFKVWFRTYLEGAEPLEPYSGLSLLEMREKSRRFLKMDMEGFDDATTGLAQAYTTGAPKKVVFRVRIPFTHCAFIEESKASFGLSPALMAASEYELKLEADPFTAANSALSVASCTVTYAPLLRTSVVGRFSIPVHTRRITGDKTTTPTTPVGLVFSAEQDGALATSGIDRIKVAIKRGRSVGGELVVVNDPFTPDDVQRVFEGTDTAGEPEKAIKARRTPFYLTSDGPLGSMVVGAVEVKQLDEDEDFVMFVDYAPGLSWAQTKAVVAAEAKALKGQQQLLAVNAAVYDEAAVENIQLGYSGIVFIPSDMTDFGEYCGLRADSSGSVEVEIPPNRARAFAARIAIALMPSESYPRGNTRAAESIYREAAREIPGATDPLEGFEVSTWVMEQVKLKLAPEVAAQQQRLERAMAA